MKELLSFAKKMLNQHGEFHPFGGYLDDSGAVVHVGVQSNEVSLNSRQKIDLLVDSFGKFAMAGKAIAVGIVSNVTLPKDDGSTGDAIEFFLEHSDGYCAEVFFRYEAGAGGIEITDTTAQQGRPLIFNKAH